MIMMKNQITRERGKKMTLMGVYTETVAPPKVPIRPEVLPRQVKVVTAERTGEKVKIVVLKPGDFGGEYRKNGFFYLLVLWLVSIWAMIINSFQVLFVRVFQARKSTFREIMWKMGRDPNVCERCGAYPLFFFLAQSRLAIFFILNFYIF